jgi:hypothetical protein
MGHDMIFHIPDAYGMIKEKTGGQILMSEFASVLISNSKSNIIPDNYDFFGGLTGEWDFEWVDNHGTEQERHIKGEWIFSWVLGGTAVQDIFICPSRVERIRNNQPDAEYGTTLRIYNPKSQAWDIFYGCTGQATRLEARKEGETIVLTELKEQKMKWVFSEITEKSFHWQNLKSDDGGAWKLQGELFASRRV